MDSKIGAMNDAGASAASRVSAVRASRELSDSKQKRRTVRSSSSKQWQPPEGLAASDVLAVIDAALSERDRLLLRVLWATGARISEAPTLRPLDVRRDSLVLTNPKNPSRSTKQVLLPAGQMDLSGTLLLWATEQQVAETAPLFFSRKRGPAGQRRAITRQQAWEIVRRASARANVRVLALRPSGYGQSGEPAPVHPHLFRHARVRQIVRTTKSLPIAHKQAGWSRLRMAYLTVSDDEVRAAMSAVTE
jgi:integrase